MKCITVTVVMLALVHVGTSLEYKEDFDYDEPKGRELEEYSEDADDVVPEYKLKDAPELFRDFMKSYNKKYRDDQDYGKHYRNFLSNLEYIIENNQQGGAAKLDINMFADLGDDEVKSLTG